MRRKNKEGCREEANERDAIKLGFIIISGRYDGEDDFSKGMKLLQKRRRRCKNETRGRI